MARSGTASLRVGLVAAGSAVAIVLALVLARAGGQWAGGLLIVGLAGVACVAVGAASRSAGGVALGTLLIATEAVIGLADGRSPAVELISGPALLVAAELAWLAGELHPQVEVELAAIAPRLQRVAAVAVAGAVVAEAALLAGGVNGPAPLTGAIAALLVAFGLVVLALRNPDRRSDAND